MKSGQQAVYIESATIEALRGAIDTLRQTGTRSVMIFACEGDNWAIGELETYLRSLDLPVFGGIFPSIIHGSTLHRSGTLVVGFPLTLEVAVISRLRDQPSIDRQLQRLGKTLADCRSVFVLVDGLSTNLESFIESLFGVLGARAAVMGGGAGYLDLLQRPCLLCNHGVIVDSALLVALPMRVDRGIGHGWQMLSGPFLVTRSNGNVLEELNYRPAIEIYQQEVEAHSTSRFSQTDFFSISKTYPLGIESIDGDFLVRDPIKQVGGALICVGEVPENATVYLLKGEASALVAAAAQAATNALAMRETRLRGVSAAPQAAIIFDCISRALFLDDGFSDELRAIERALPPMDCVVGALTIGEIVSSRSGLIELMNKSILVGLS